MTEKREFCFSLCSDIFLKKIPFSIWAPIFITTIGAVSGVVFAYSINDLRIKERLITQEILSKENKSSIDEIRRLSDMQLAILREIRDKLK